MQACTSIPSFHVGYKTQAFTQTSQGTQCMFICNTQDKTANDGKGDREKKKKKKRRRKNSATNARVRRIHKSLPKINVQITVWVIIRSDKSVCERNSVYRRRLICLPLVNPSKNPLSSCKETQSQQRLGNVSQYRDHE